MVNTTVNTAMNCAQRAALPPAHATSKTCTDQVPPNHISHPQVEDLSQLRLGDAAKRHGQHQWRLPRCREDGPHLFPRLQALAKPGIAPLGPAHGEGWYQYAPMMCDMRAFTCVTFHTYKQRVGVLGCFVYPFLYMHHKLKSSIPFKHTYMHHKQLKCQFLPNTLHA